MLVIFSTATCPLSIHWQLLDLLHRLNYSFLSITNAHPIEMEFCYIVNMTTVFFLRQEDWGWALPINMLFCKGASFGRRRKIEVPKCILMHRRVMKWMIFQNSIVFVWWMATRFANMIHFGLLPPSSLYQTIVVIRRNSKFYGFVDWKKSSPIL